jgi:hypothetical protein
MKEIIRYILRYYKDPDTIPTPTREVLHFHLKSKYPKNRINDHIESLLEQNILTEYGEYDYLDFTGSFIRSEDYKKFEKSV